MRPPARDYVCAGDHLPAWGARLHQQPDYASHFIITSRGAAERTC
jgi:hypothetical protein